MYKAAFITFAGNLISVKGILFSIAVLAVLYSNGQAAGNPSMENLKLNQLQVVATHNSYHIKTDHAVFRFLTFLYGMRLLPRDLNPQGIDYTKDPLTVQLQDYNVRGLELDAWNDPKGGHFYHRMGKAYVWKCTTSHIDELKQPGFKIIHIPDFDFNSTNNTLVSALTEIKAWSDAHPNHVPVFINIEEEVAAPGDIVHQLHRLTKAVPFDSVAADELDREVKLVFGDKLEGVITPDKVRGNDSTLRQAATTGRWPTLAEARGKVVFIIDGSERSSFTYFHGHPSLKGRTMFIYANPDSPEAAFVILNDPTNDFKQIQQRVKEGFIVRTRSDGDTRQARTGDSTDLKAAFSSSAQIISTDYYKPDPRSAKKNKKWSTYHVQLPKGAAALVDSIATPNRTFTIVTE